MFKLSILISGISNLGPLILGILISNFPFPFGILTPTLTSGINKLCLFNIMGSSTLPLNLMGIFLEFLPLEFVYLH